MEADFKLILAVIPHRCRLTILMVFWICCFSYSQKARIVADQAFDLLRYHEAITLYDQYYTQSGDTLALERKALCYIQLGNNDEALKLLGKCWPRVKKNNKLLVQYAELLYSQGLRDSSYAVTQDYISQFGIVAKIEKLQASILGYVGLNNSSDAYVIAPVSFNSGAGDYCPVYYGDQIIFTSHRQGISDAWTGRPFSGIFMTNQDQSSVTPLHIEMATDYHNGVVSMSDKQTFYFTSNSQVKGKLNDYNLHIAVAGKSPQGNWVHSGLFPFSTPEYNVAYPALSADGNKIIFCSDKTGSKGGFDLYMSQRKEGQWDTPIHLKEISTAGDDVFPFLADNGILYFSSDGLQGLGGLDIYSIKLDEFTTSLPLNAGPLINSSADDFGLITRDGLISGYLSSNRDNKEGIDKIYKFQKKKNNVE